MRGFQPHVAQRSAQNYADGGIVQRIKQTLGMDPERNAQIAAYRAQAEREKQAAQPAAPASAAPPQKALSEYSGGSATQRRMKEIDSYKNGGMVRGPGTGTSDEVPDQVAEGTYIMPADSTKAIGPGALSQAAKIPVNLSNGEFKLPPEQVHAVGVQALNQMKDATHAPVGFNPQHNKAKPDLFFANGGDVTREGNSYSGMSVTGDISVNGQPGGASTGQPNAQNMAAAQTLSDRGAQGFAPAAPATPAPPAAATAAVPAPGAAPATPTAPAAPMGWAERNAQRNTSVTASSIMDSPERRAAQASLGMTPAATAAPAQNSAPMMATPDAPAAPAPPPVSWPRPAPPPVDIFKPRGFASGGEVRRNPAGASELYMQDRKQEMADQWDAGNYAGLVGTAARTATQGLGMYGLEMADKTLSPMLSASQRFAGGVLGTDTPSGEVAGGRDANPAPMPAVPAKVAPMATNPVDQRLANGQQQTPAASPAMETTAPPTGQPSPQSMAAAQALSDRGTQGFAPATAPANVQAPIVRHSGNDWAARNALRNAEVSASSIMNRAKWSQSGIADEEGKIAAFRAAKSADAALQAAQPGMDQAAMRENGANQRATMQEQGATNRAGMQERGASNREAGRLGLSAQELAMRQETQGFQTRAAAQMEQMRSVLLDPASTAEQRKVANRILSNKGEGADWGIQVTPATKNADGSTTEGSVIRYNKSTGQVEKVDGGQQAQPQPQPVKGKTYTDAKGNKAMYDGTKYVAVK